MRRFVPLTEFCGDRRSETEYERRERRAVMHEIRGLFHAERRARRHLAIRASVERLHMPRARASHRVGSPAASTTSGDDDGEGDGEPPRQLERIAVATVRPDGRPAMVCIEVDPLHIDPTAIVFAARRAAGHSVASASTGLDRLHVDVVHPYVAKGGAA